MLRSLHIRDFVIVDAAQIAFEPGFTVFSGETGAGKSILIDALSLALGARGDATLLREGAVRADISAIFDTPPGVLPWLQQRELADDEGTLVLRRTLDDQGRSRAYINGVPAPLTQVRELAVQLIDIHGQHAHQSLLNAASQRELLDGQGGHAVLAHQVQAAWQQCTQARNALDLALRDADARRQEQERLQWQVDELERLKLSPTEWQTLDAEHSRLAHAQALLDGAAQALTALDDDTGAGAQQRLDAAAHSLRQALRHDAQLQDMLDGIESARIATAQAASDLNSYLARLEPDPQRLVTLEQRLSALFDAARKYHVEPPELPDLLDTLRVQQQASLQAADVQALEQALAQAQAQYHDLARQLSRKRAETAKRLSGQVTAAMQTLAMPGGVFQVALHENAPAAHGLESVEFLVAAHAGATPRPLARVASGGELSRLSLALSVIASQAARVPTLIFDEVDSGIGGAVAEVVGRLLGELGQRHQVLCVTHLPQVAACGTQHYRVAKTTCQGTTTSTITLLDPTERTEEIARMLGGLNITATTRKHAREMLGETFGTSA